MTIQPDRRFYGHYVGPICGGTQERIHQHPIQKEDSRFGQLHFVRRLQFKSININIEYHNFIAIGS